MISNLDQQVDQDKYSENWDKAFHTEYTNGWCKKCGYNMFKCICKELNEPRPATED